LKELSQSAFAVSIGQSGFVQHRYIVDDGAEVLGLEGSKIEVWEALKIRDDKLLRGIEARVRLHGGEQGGGGLPGCDGIKRGGELGRCELLARLRLHSRRADGRLG
jgi:hypothetical protein